MIENGNNNDATFRAIPEDEAVVHGDLLIFNLLKMTCVLAPVPENNDNNSENSSES